MIGEAVAGTVGAATFGDAGLGMPLGDGELAPLGDGNGSGELFALGDEVGVDELVGLGNVEGTGELVGLGGNGGVDELVGLGIVEGTGELLGLGIDDGVGELVGVGVGEGVGELLGLGEGEAASAADWSARDRTASRIPMSAKASRRCFTPGRVLIRALGNRRLPARTTNSEGRPEPLRMRRYRTGLMHQRTAASTNQPRPPRQCTLPPTLPSSGAPTRHRGWSHVRYAAERPRETVLPPESNVNGQINWSINGWRCGVAGARTDRPRADDI